MKKIKVLRIIARLNIGGPAIHAILLSENLDKDIFESLLVHGSIGAEEGDMSYYAKDRQIKTIYLPEMSREINSLKDLLALQKIYSIICSEKPDIIHTHTAKAGTLGRLAGIIYNFLHPFKNKIRLVHTFHGHIFEGYFHKTRAAFFACIERSLAKFSLVVTVSQALKQELVALKIAKPDKIRVIPLGLELEPFLKIPLKGIESSLKVGIVGRLVAIKNHRLFIESASLIIKNNPGMDIRFKIVGDGELRDNLKQYADQLYLGSRIEFLGWQRDLTKIYSELDIVTLTSLNEGTPVSLIEAMASARPVVATAVGGVGDLLAGLRQYTTDCGFKILERAVIVFVHRPDIFAAALEALLNNPEARRNLGIAGREYVKNKYTKERLLNDIKRLYLEISNQPV